MKPKIFFIPRYIASLKYYEKLFPALCERFSPFFLLFEDKGMVAYCRGHSIPFYDGFLKLKEGESSTFRIPFLSHIQDHNAILRHITHFLDIQKPKRIISETALDFNTRSLFHEANLRGIDTVALQWCLQSTKTRAIKLRVGQYMQKFRARYGSVLKGIIMESYFFLLGLVFRALDFFRKGPHYMSSDLNAKRLGVIDGYARKVFLAFGWPAEKISIVGHADFELVRELKKRFEHDPAFSKALLGKYGLSQNKKHILVVSNIFYAGHVSVFTDRAGQIAYFRKIFEAIRKVVPEREADILFKLHPREGNIYQSCEELGIRVYGTEANIEELIVLSGLYIAHPMTAANFSILPSGVPAIFINFTPLTFLSDVTDYYHIHHVVSDWSEFGAMLHGWHNGFLSPQYDDAETHADALKQIIKFVSAS